MQTRVLRSFGGRGRRVCITLILRPFREHQLFSSVGGVKWIGDCWTASASAEKEIRKAHGNRVLLHQILLGFVLLYPSIPAHHLQWNIWLTRLPSANDFSHDQSSAGMPRVASELRSLTLARPRGVGYSIWELHLDFLHVAQEATGRESECLVRGSKTARGTF